MTNHPITPSPELVQQWAKHILTPEEGNLTLDLDWFANQAARWGADQELEACCEWVRTTNFIGLEGHETLRTARRRSKPPSLKEQALEALEQLLQDPEAGCFAAAPDTIRRALEALPND